MAESDKIRAFIAVSIPQEIRMQISDVAGEVLKTPEELKIVKPDNYHLTLAFIGEVSQSVLEPLEKPFSLFCESFKQFHVQFGKVGTFPGVIFIKTTKGEEKLIDLATAVRTILRNNSVPYDGKPFKGHLTLARVKNRNSKALGYLIEGAADKSFSIGYQVREFIIYKSELKPSGPIYAKLWTFNLAPLNDS